MSKSSEDRRPSPLSERALRQLIRTAIDKSYYCESIHAENDHLERSIDANDVLHGLERDDWVIEGTPEWVGNPHNNWKYLIKTVDIEGNELHIVVAAIPSYRRFEVITRW
jgi:hypothetical protein